MAKEPREFDNSICSCLLKKFQEALKVKLKGYYTWDFDETKLNDIKGGKELIAKIQLIKKFKDKDKGKENIPQKTEFLKKELKNKLKIKKNDNKAYLDFAKWVIGSWGGIKNPPSTDKILKYQQNVFDGRLSFDSISSFSKVASFLNDTEYAVYDSRVAFTLNWLIYSNGWYEKDKGNMKFFRQPSGKNTDMKIHQQKPIFMKHFRVPANNTKWFTENFYYSKEETYQKYCTLLKEACNYWNKDLNKKEHITIGMLEMCLFSIAAKDGRRGTIKSLYEGKFITQEMDSHSKPEAL